MRESRVTRLNNFREKVLTNAFARNSAGFLVKILDESSRRVCPGETPRSEPGKRKVSGGKRIRES